MSKQLQENVLEDSKGAHRMLLRPEAELIDTGGKDPGKEEQKEHVPAKKANRSAEQNIGPQKQTHSYNHLISTF